MRLSLLALTLFGFLSTAVMACGGDKDGDKEKDYRSQNSHDITKVFSCEDDKKRKKEKDRV